MLTTLVFTIIWSSSRPTFDHHYYYAILSLFRFRFFFYFLLQGVELFLWAENNWNKAKQFLSGIIKIIWILSS